MPSVYTFCLSLGMGTRVWLLRVHAAWQYFCFNPSLLVPPLSKTCPTPTNPYRGRSGECNKQGRTDFHTRRIHQLTSACPLPRNGTASKTGYRGHGKNVRLTRGGHCHTPRQLGCMSLPTDACEERLATHATGRCARSGMASPGRAGDAPKREDFCESTSTDLYETESDVAGGASTDGCFQTAGTDFFKLWCKAPIGSDVQESRAARLWATYISGPAV